MRTPHYLTNNALPGSVLVIDENNKPVFQGYREVPFSVYIPRSCADGSKAPCAIMEYGHGLLGARNEV